MSRLSLSVKLIISYNLIKGAIHMLSVIFGYYLCFVKAGYPFHQRNITKKCK